MAESFSMRRSLRIEWKVKNIFSVDSVETPMFSFGSSGCMFQLKAYGTEETECIVVYLLRKNSNETPLNEIRVDIFIEDRNGKPQFPMAQSSSDGKVMVWNGYASQLRGEEIFSTTGVVKFVCVLVLESIPEDEFEKEAFKETLANVETGNGLENFSPHLHHLLDMKASPDVMLKCGDYVIPAHKSTLCARSEVFLDLFRSDQTRSPCEILEISDMEPLILDQLVKYIYTGKVSDLSMDSAQQLYAAADKHAIESLKGLCGNFLMENLEEENACDVLVFAEAHSDTDIKDCALSFIIETELLRDDDHWLKFRQEHSELAADVLHMVYKATCLAK